MKIRKVDPCNRLRILLTNGRFPVALDLARQLHKLGHTIYVVDPMHFHVTKFSRASRKCFRVPAPHGMAAGYISSVKVAVMELHIQLIIPLHEEIFCLAQVDALRPCLFAPPFHTLLALHNKWHFHELVNAIGFSTPTSYLCRSMDDVRKLNLAEKEYALKPVFGRALSGLHHLKPGHELPNVDIREDCQYIAQEWVYGKQVCSYSVVRDGEVKACAIYPVIDTIDGSSCVYFQSIDHPGVKQFTEQFARIYHLTGQLAFDFIETDEKLVLLECNPRATSGIHLFEQTPWLAEAFTNLYAQRHDAVVGVTRQMVPGMMMWHHGNHPTMRKRAQHLKRLFGTRDVLFGRADPAPAFAQPFLYISYARLCHQHHLKLKELFQWDLIWEPTREQIERAREEALVSNDSIARNSSILTL